MKFITIILSIVTFNLQAQINNVVVDYGLVIGENEQVMKTDLMKDNYKAAMESSNLLQFKLVYANKKSSFIQAKILKDNGYGIAFAKAFSGAGSDFYMDYNENKVYQNYDTAVLGKYTQVSEIKKYNWALTNETKTIEGFVCYKATTTDMVVNTVGTFSFPITAWYCPKIPVSIGPLSFNGLPGLILEVERRNVVFGAKKIVINANIEPKLEKPIIHNLKTEAEVAQMRADFLKNQ
jgi:GLPGLI family protein